jgi:hypothetical protein
MLADIYNWFTEGFDTADLKGRQGLARSAWCVAIPGSHSRRPIGWKVRSHGQGEEGCYADQRPTDHAHDRSDRTRTPNGTSEVKGNARRSIVLDRGRPEGTQRDEQRAMAASASPD